MLHTIFIKCKVDVMYFIFIFILSSRPRFSVKKSVNQLIKNKRPNRLLCWDHNLIYYIKCRILKPGNNKSLVRGPDLNYRHLNY